MDIGDAQLSLLIGAGAILGLIYFIIYFIRLCKDAKAIRQMLEEKENQKNNASNQGMEPTSANAQSVVPND